MIMFLALIALIVVVIGLMVYQTIMDDKIKKLNEKVDKLSSQILEIQNNN